MNYSDWTLTLNCLNRSTAIIKLRGPKKNKKTSDNKKPPFDVMGE